MARALHVLKGDHASDAATVIESQIAAGDHVTVALLADARLPELPGGIEIHRVPGDTSYERLLELIFEADSVVTW